MREFIGNNLNHVLFAILLVSRIGDIASTYLATPKLKMEGNVIAKKLGWPFAVLTILVSFIAYYNTAIALALIAPSLLVSSMNFGKVWIMRTMGELEYRKMLLSLARRSQLRYMIFYILLSSLYMGGLGLLVMLFYPDPSEDWGFWVGFGILGFALVILVHGSIFSVKLFKEAAAVPESVS